MLRFWGRSLCYFSLEKAHLAFYLLSLISPLAIRRETRVHPLLLDKKRPLLHKFIHPCADKGVCKPPLNAGLIAIQFLFCSGAAPAAHARYTSCFDSAVKKVASKSKMPPEPCDYKDYRSCEK